VTALKGTREELNSVWIGWLGQEIMEADQPMVREKLLREYNALPVFISDDLAKRLVAIGCFNASKKSVRVGEWWWWWWWW